jgi:hypothetical protein
METAVANEKALLAEGFVFRISGNRVLSLRELAAAPGSFATQDACTKNQHRAQHDEASGFRKRAEALDVFGNNIVEFEGPGQNTSAKH